MPIFQIAHGCIMRGGQIHELLTHTFGPICGSVQVGSGANIALLKIGSYSDALSITKLGA